jgi:hypothetical protein
MISPRSNWEFSIIGQSGEDIDILALIDMLMFGI